MAFAPEAQEVLDILDARIAAAQAGQASRDAFLEALDSPESGCADWAAMRFWKKDPDLREAVEEACPELRPAPAAQGRSGSPSYRLTASQSVRPAGAGPADPTLSAMGRKARVGAEAAGSASGLQRRRAWLRGEKEGGSGPTEKSDPPGVEWALQAGSLDFRPLEPNPEGSTDSEGRHRPGHSPALPRLDFLLGRRSLPGSGWLSGLEGHLEARSPALDGLGFTAGAPDPVSWEAGALATWNRRAPSGDATGASPRRDASVLSLAGGLTAGSWFAAAQAVQFRLETAGAAPVTAWSAGAVLGPASGRLRLGVAASALWPQGGPWESRESAPGAPGASPGAGPPETGGYGEIALSDGKPGGYLLEWRQATPRWAAPLSASPAIARDTLEEGLVIKGRGEGGLRARTRLDLLEAVPAAPFRLSLAAAGEAAWNPEGPLAGDGRLNLALGRGPWSLEAGTGLRWRRADLDQGGSHRAGSAALGWSQGPWRARAALSRRLTGRLAGKDYQESWPFSAEAARTGREGGRWKVEVRLADAARPSREAALAFRQGWRLGKGLTLTQSVRIPWVGGEPGRDLGYQVRLDFAAL